jgi:hypothetical protein
VDVENTAADFAPFLHAFQPEPAHAVISVENLIHIESATIVLNFEYEVGGLPSQANMERVGPAVLGRVGKGLLHHPIDHDLNPWGFALRRFPTK